MLHFLRKFFVVFFVTLLLCACSSVPITGRSQLSLIPSSQMMSMSASQYGDFLETNKLSNDQASTRMVNRVGKNIQNAVERYFADNGLSEDLEGYDWEFNLVESDQVNAWAMPGGKVVIYEGILDVTQDEAGLAVVMGHEIAHAVAKHGNERMSQGLLAQMGGIALSVALSEEPGTTQQLWMAAFGAGAQFGVLLPFSRLHENEADHLGLIFMAMAGYDPNRAVEFWTQMAEAKEGKSIPEFASTHPADETRIANIQSKIPEAMQYFRSAE